MTRDISLKVFLHFEEEKRFVGELLHHHREILFEYDIAFLNSKIDISPFKLPLQSGIQKNGDHTFQGLPGVFHDSLPDGRGIQTLYR